jgi:hypothetical protein
MSLTLWREGPAVHNDFLRLVMVKLSPHRDTLHGESILREGIIPISPTLSLNKDSSRSVRVALRPAHRASAQDTNLESWIHPAQGFDSHGLAQTNQGSTTTAL